MNALLDTPTPKKKSVQPIVTPAAIPAAVQRPRESAGANFEPPVAVNRRGKQIPVESLSVRRKRMTWLGNMVVATVCYAVIAMIVCGTSTLAARVRMEGVRNQGIAALKRSKAAVASIDRMGTVNSTDQDLDRWATSVGFTEATATQVAYVDPVFALPVKNSDSMVAAGPSVKVIRVAAR